MLLKGNYKLLSLFEEQFKAMESELESQQRWQELRQSLVTYTQQLSDRIRNSIDFAINETTEKATDFCPYFQSPLSSLIWFTASQRKTTGLLFDELLPELTISPGTQLKPIEISDWKANGLEENVEVGKEGSQEQQERLKAALAELGDAHSVNIKLQQALEIREKKLQEAEFKCKQLQSSLEERIKILKINREDLKPSLGNLFPTESPEYIAPTVYQNPVDSDYGQPPIEPPDYPLPSYMRKPATDMKPPKTCFLQYYHGRRAAIKAQQPELSSNEVSCIIGSEWKKMTKVQQAKYVEMYRNEKRRYDEDLVKKKQKREGDASQP